MDEGSVISTHPAFCSDSPFWDLNLTWYSEVPDFTRCFQRTALTWIPCGILFIFTLLEIHQLRKSNNGKIPWRWKNITRLVVMVILAVLSAMDTACVIYMSSTGVILQWVDHLDVYLLFIANIFVGISTTVSVYKGRRTSSLFSVFWTLLLIGHIIRLRSIILHMNDPGYEFKVIELVQFPFIVIAFIIFNVQDNPPPKYDQDVLMEKDETLWSKMTVSWVNAIIRLGFSNKITADKLKRLLPETSVQKTTVPLERRWRDELKTKNPSLTKVLIKTYWFDFLLCCSTKIISTLVKFLNPQLLDLMISLITSNEPQWRGFLYAFSMFFVSIVVAVCNLQTQKLASSLGIFTRSAMMSIVYKKAMKMSLNAKSQTSTGKIINLMSIDAKKFRELPLILITVLFSPITVAIALYFLWQILGVSCMAGLIVMAIFIPINLVVASFIKRMEVENLTLNDARLKKINESLSGIRILKLYAWEVPMMDRITAVRKLQLETVRKYGNLVSVMVMFFRLTPDLVVLASFAMFVLIDPNNVLTANVAFVSISLMNIMRPAVNQLPNNITSIYQFSVSMKRLTDFFLCEESEGYEICTEDSSSAISIENGNFTWDVEEQFQLKDIEMRIPKGKLTAIVGDVGSGKSSILSAILGEMSKTTGTVKICGTIGYVPQQAWVMNMIAKKNIVFINDADEVKYQEVVKACRLTEDFRNFFAGDQTEIGEKGINLSGGQKQRVCLARAIYHDADIYLLDDILSAVDSHVGTAIFNNVIGVEGLLKNKTRVLVTHRVRYLPKCDQIIVMTDGQVSECGTYEQLLQSGEIFSEFLKRHMNEEKGEEDENKDVDEDTHAEVEETTEDIEDEDLHQGLQRILSRTVSKMSGKSDGKSKAAADRSPSKQEKSQLIEVEQMKKKSVTWKSFISYSREMGWALLVAIIVFQAASKVCSGAANLWLNEWTSDYESPNNSPVTTTVRLLVYASLIIGQGVAFIAGALLMVYGTVKVSAVLHTGILNSVFHAPTRFFDTTPIGRVINRFSQDMDTVDMQLSKVYRMTLVIGLTLVEAITVIEMQTPLFILAAVVIFIVYIALQRIYIRTSNQLRRLESISLSPIFSRFSESITGLTSIRAYRLQEAFVHTTDESINNFTKVSYQLVHVNFWMLFRVQVLGALIVLAACIFAVVARANLDPGSVALSITYASRLTMILNQLITSVSTFENNLVAVERIAEYSKLEAEDDWVKAGQRPSRDWPSCGHITFKNYQTRYRKGLDLVLKGLNFDIKPSEKVGICGRTGSGKSSLTLALFRIIEPTSGTITIDGIDITKIGLHDLRSILTIIPQDPVLFAGTIRMNLDPFVEFSDNELWKVLELANIKSYVDSLAEGLDYQLAEGGENLSVGQRQLFCLGRALLRKSKILVLDEATASVDLGTDQLIQETIRTAFSGNTVITIAHRINTILDYNRILVMEDGVIKELDTPQALLSNPRSIFHNMAEQEHLI